jgi:hypothetical protein
MNSKEFFLSAADGKITVNQPIGIISLDRPHTFVAAYFRRGIFPSRRYNLDLSLNQALGYIPSSDKIVKNIRSWYFRDETETIFTDKERFEEKMQSLMTEVTKKDNFPLFIRDLSKLEGWK